MKSIWATRKVKVAETEEHYATIKIKSSSDAIDAIRKTMGGYFDSLDVEEFHILALDTKNKVLAIFFITRGTLDASLVHPREIFKPAIMVSASSIILTHNHPSGESTPSREDIAVTDRLTEAGKLLGIDVLDHIVYGAETNITSIREYEG